MVKWNSIQWAVATGSRPARPAGRYFIMRKEVENQAQGVNLIGAATENEVISYILN